MCGILAHINSSPLLPTEGIRATLSKRGSDYFSTFKTENNHFYHSLLALTDTVQNSIQPLISDQFVVLLNGEIYNHLELRTQYLTEYHFKSQTDTETLLAGFETLQTNFLQYLRGMFALVIYDKINHKTYIYRDHFGIKPLYYIQENKGITLSSSLDYFKKSEKNNDTIQLNKKWGWSMGEQTLLKKALSFPKGKLGVFDSKTGEFHIKDVNPFITHKENVLFELIKRSVKEQSLSPYKTGILFSGGIDSTLLALASKELALNLPLYTFDFKGNQQKYGYSEDLSYAKKIAKHLNLQLHIISYTEKDFDEYLNIHKHFPEPYLDLAGFSLHLLCKQAKKDTVKVLLNGTGADEFFGGYRRHQFARKLNWIPRFFHSYILNYLVNKQFTILSLFEKKILKQYKGLSFSDMLLNYDQNEYLENNNLKYTDGIGLYNDIEIRVPFLTSEITHFGKKELQENQFGKPALKDILYKHFPKEFIDRPKSGFALPLQALGKNVKKLRNKLLENWFNELENR
jgi:asparagine synthase (glutamine-hydrolysing)